MLYLASEPLRWTTREDTDLWGTLALLSHSCLVWKPQ